MLKHFLKQNGKTRNLNTGKEIEYYALGIRTWGYEIIDLLLDKSVGHGRVLIDTKHMSIAARKDYHQYIFKKNQSSDQIPIIQTHTAVNGRSFNELKKQLNNNQELRNKYARNSKFNTASINLFNEEIVEIIESDGLIGFMLDEKRLIGKKLPADTRTICLETLDYNKSLRGSSSEARRLELQQNKKAQNRLLFTKDLFKVANHQLIKSRKELEELKLKKNKPQDAAKRKDRLKLRILDYQKNVNRLRGKLENAEMSILFNQFFHVLKVSASYGDKGWYHICIGSDYDGTINPSDIFYYAGNLKNLESRMIRFWKKYSKRSEAEFAEYRNQLYNQTIEYWVKKILWENSQAFLKKYFTDTYRKK